MPQLEPPASALCDLALSRVGEKYVLGCQVPKDDPDWHGPWDCAEYASWLAYQIARILIGCTSTGKTPARADAYSGAWARDAKSIPGIRVSPEVAAATPGAILVREPSTAGASGHVAVSLGGGRTVEAYDSKRGVIVSTSTGRRWDHGVLIPGVKYDVAVKPIALDPPPVLKQGAKGAEVRKLQEALNGAGYVLAVDGDFGRATAAAVIRFQESFDLVPDGEVGPMTWAVLEAVQRKPAAKTTKKKTA
jgi:hypothetical protein